MELPNIQSDVNAIQRSVRAGNFSVPKSVHLDVYNKELRQTISSFEDKRGYEDLAKALKLLLKLSEGGKLTDKDNRAWKNHNLNFARKHLNRDIAFRVEGSYNVILDKKLSSFEKEQVLDNTMTEFLSELERKVGGVKDANKRKFLSSQVEILKALQPTLMKYIGGKKRGFSSPMAIILILLSVVSFKFLGGALLGAMLVKGLGYGVVVFNVFLMILLMLINIDDLGPAVATGAPSTLALLYLLGHIEKLEKGKAG